jgi:O-antigen/teichoic acid export membrane protein
MGTGVTGAGLQPRHGLLGGTAWNLLGLVVPLVVAVVAIPWLMSALGLKRFGFLALVWAVVGYASVLDLGIGKTLIRLVARQLADGKREAARALATVATQLLLLLGLLLALLLWLLTGLVLASTDASASLPADEAAEALAVVAALLPLVLVNSAQVAMLSAWQDFKRLNLLRAVFSTLTYLAPLTLALLDVLDLRVIVSALLLVRACAVLAFGWACHQRCGWVPWPRWPAREDIVSLLAVGRWMFIAGLAGPLLTYLDRFVVGLQLPLREVALYAAPSEIPNRLLMLPYALLTALFPRVAAQGGDPEALRRVLGQSVRWLCALITPMAVVGVALAVPAMSLWLGAEHGPVAGAVLQVLLVGLWVSSLSMGPVTVLQAAGDLRHVALFYLLQLPLLLGLLWLLTDSLGIVGAAIAVALRQGVDTAGMLFLAVQQVGRPAGRWRRFALGLAATVAMLLLAAASQSWLQGLAVAATGLVLCAVLAVWCWIDAEEQARLRGWLSARGARPAHVAAPSAHE